MAPRAIIVCALKHANSAAIAKSFEKTYPECLKLVKRDHGDLIQYYMPDEHSEILRICAMSETQLWLTDCKLLYDPHRALILMDCFEASDAVTTKIFDVLEDCCANYSSQDYHFRQNREFRVVGYGRKSLGGESYCRHAIQAFKLLKAGGFGTTGKILLINEDESTEVHSKLLLSYLWLSDSISCRPRQPSENANRLADEVQDVESLRSGNADTDGTAEMLTSEQRTKLKKQGYRIVGSHSAVKLCRWTKSQLRGYGGCYKHTFYGLQSHQCMEATCCLACANKCIFCWRHQTNPTSTHWNWAVDSAEFIVSQTLTNHLDMLKIYKGAFGVQERGRLPSSMNVAHCALSLVGEPLMYPNINSLLDQLHQRRISSFLVNNGQFPDQLKVLGLCTQLYISVDAGDPVTMKELDRPLHADYWERFLKSLRALNGRLERTVYRLTMIRDQNIDDAQAYANLVTLGQPNFIEIKGVTYTGDGCGIRMTDVPRHTEIRAFAELLVLELAAINLDYGLAAEHEHSCSVLLAQMKYNINGEWRTWIDFPKFFEWVLANSGASEPLDNLDYCLPTPSWAAYNSVTRGFDPQEERKIKPRQKAATCVECGCGP